MPVTINGTNGLLQNYTTNTPTTGFSYTVTTPVTLFTPAGTLATGTVTMPASPTDGMTVTITSTQTITSLTISANSGQSITGAATTLLANASVTYVYRSSNTTWYPFATGANPVGLASIRSTSTSPTVFQNSSGTEVGTLCRAWVNFDGMLSSPITPRAAFNVGSVTKNGSGDYTINFTNALTDANYSAVFGTQSSIAPGTTRQVNILATSDTSGPTGKTASSIRIVAGAANTVSLFDLPEINAAFFR